MGPDFSLPLSIALGALQGVTEFLPISSDGHLATAGLLLGLPGLPLTFVVMLHAGTFLATLLVFRNDVWDLLRFVVEVFRRPKPALASETGQLFLALVVASIPTAVIGLLLERRVEQWNGVAWAVGAGFLGSAVAVALTRRGGGNRSVPTLGAAALVGMAQGLAVLPGLSRSASTIACAMMLGLSGPAAFRYSFLLSLPAVGGAVLLKLGKPDALAGMGQAGAAGAVTAFVTGIVALFALRKVVARGKFWAFAWYLVPLGVALIAWDRVAR